MSELEEAKEWESLLGEGIQCKTITAGEGSVPEVGHVVEYSYIGRLADGDTVFGTRQGVKTCIGDGDEIPGIELALRHMKPGETRLVKCVARFAWGEEEQSVAHAPPPNSDVVLELTLVRIATAKTPAEMSADQRLEHATFKKEVGNAHYAAKHYPKALRCYQAAMDTAQSAIQQQQGEAGSGSEEGSDADANAARNSAARALLIACANNVAMVHVQLGNLKGALDATVIALEMDPNNVKALYRAGQVSSRQGNFEEARAALKKALALDPANAAVRAETRELQQRVADYHARQRAMQEKMGAALVSKTSSAGPSDTVQPRGGGGGEGGADAVPAPAAVATDGHKDGGSAGSDLDGTAGNRGQVQWPAGSRLMEGGVVTGLVAVIAALLWALWQAIWPAAGPFVVSAVNKTPEREVSIRCQSRAPWPLFLPAPCPAPVPAAP
ncbi:hypothetical protein JKP88DRAFT_349518 [Tribonema minus]|uniref:peptidylprolyl isomerase n=1 Tax=Tribonema minus TaxID=303371 RepID=A0A835YRT2_9STRA|nr:hypothetical protein JKP88DRAFT_349518 [Tribonema minus]